MLGDLYTEGSIYAKTISAKDIKVVEDCCSSYIFCSYAEIFGDLATKVLCTQYGYKVYGEEEAPLVFIDEFYAWKMQEYFKSAPVFF